MSKSHTLANVAKDAARMALDVTPLEVGDIVSEYKKNWEAQVLDIIDKHKNYAPKYYILQLLKKEYGHTNLIRNKCFIRRTRPDPDWNTDCYSYDNLTNEFRLEWSLPPKESVSMILRNPDQWDKFLVLSIQRFLSGELKEPEAHQPDP